MSRIGAAAGAFLALSLVVGGVLPGFAQRGAIEEDPDIYFELGIDAPLLPHDAAGAKAYLAKQPAETQRVFARGLRQLRQPPGRRGDAADR